MAWPGLEPLPAALMLFVLGAVVVALVGYVVAALAVLLARRRAG